MGKKTEQLYGLLLVLVLLLLPGDNLEKLLLMSLELSPVHNEAVSRPNRVPKIQDLFTYQHSKEKQKGLNAVVEPVFLFSLLISSQAFNKQVMGVKHLGPVTPLAVQSPAGTSGAARNFKGHPWLESVSQGTEPMPRAPNKTRGGNFIPGPWSPEPPHTCT
jgi:hypothetical protein